jgi:hypothetical protein
MVAAEILTNSFDLLSFMFCTPEIIARLHPEKIEGGLWNVLNKAAACFWGSSTPELSRLMGSVFGAGLGLAFFGNGLRISIREAAQPIADHDFTDFHVPLALAMAIPALVALVVFVASIAYLLVRVSEKLLEAYPVRKLLFGLGAGLFFLSRLYALCMAIFG